ncbi:MAG: FtsQ-type POTRA domain-containing protein [Firmicutes bacterium]|nr:FtsQ-type POTRA domain-containing protein [Bacillota bacterium]
MATKEKTRKSAGKTSTPRKRAAKDAQARRKPSTRAQDPMQDVVYLPPKPFHRNRFLLRLASVAAVVLALMLGVSVFFKVENIVVSGTEVYSAWDITQASGIQENDNLLAFGRIQAEAKILTALPYVKSVRIGIKLPDTVYIEIEEVQVTYAAESQDGTWWLLSSDGKVVAQSEDGQSGGTQILGITLSSPAVGEQAQALEETQTTQDETQTPVTVTAAQKLSTALDIAQYLEMNGIIGEAASVDVSNLQDIQLWYGEQYQVKLGDTSQLSYKISFLKSAIDALDTYQSGVLDVSLTEETDGVVYTPFA